MRPAPRGAGEAAEAAWLGWGLASASVAWAAFVHHGLGPPRAGAALRWYEPRGFLLPWDAARATGAAGDAEGEPRGGPWSCPSRPPELW